MHNQDYTAAKLTGHNCHIKFIDGESIFITIGPDQYSIDEWVANAQDFINDESVTFYIDKLALSRCSIKYIRGI